MSNKLANNLKLHLDDEVTFIGSTMNGAFTTFNYTLVGTVEANLYVRFRLVISKDGKLSNWEFIEKSSSNTFNQAAELSIRNARFRSLPEILAANPPYIVIVKIESNQ